MDVLDTDVGVMSDEEVIAHLSVSFYMGFLTFDVSFREFYDRRLERTHWLHSHFANFIPFIAWRRLVELDVNLRFFDMMLPDDYESLQTLTSKHVWTFVHNCLQWDTGKTDDIDEYFKYRRTLRHRRRKQ